MASFAHDLRIDVSAFDRGPLIKVMKRYFDLKGFETDWTQIENSDNDQLWQRYRWFARLR